MRILTRLISSTLFCMAVIGCDKSNYGNGDSTPPDAGPTPTPGSAVLTWTAPTAYEDSSPLTVERFKIYSGPAADDLRFVDDVAGTQTTYTVLGLSSGTHYFAVTAVGDNGEESGSSPIGSKTIP